MDNIICKTEDVTIAGAYPLYGTITLPKGTTGKRPAILFIAGSGMIDRNGYATKLRFYFNAYTQMADKISDAGFITLRFDKRGVGQSGGVYSETGMWDRVDDVEACIKYLEGRPEVDPDRIILIGHSEGCMLASAVNARHPVSGMILLGGAAETLKQASERQRKLAMEELMNAKGIKGAFCRLLKADKLAEKQNAKMMGKIMQSPDDMIKFNFMKLNAKWLREHYLHDVVEDLKKAVCPVLAITGSRDCQADPERIKGIPGMVPGGEYRIIDDMDHSLKSYKGELYVNGIVKQYKLSEKEPVHPALEKTILDWLSNNFKA